MKRKRPTNEKIGSLSSLQKALVKTESELGCKIPPLLLVVIIQNGVLESILQLLVRTDIEVIVLSQRESGSVLFREICIRMKLGGIVIMHAKSRIDTKNLPPVLINRIIEGKKGIGSLIENLRIETFRHIKNIGFDRRQRAIYRIYEIYIRKQLAITIREYFPLDVPIWNLR